MKTFKQFISETDLTALGNDIARTAKKEKPIVNKPDFGSSQSEPKAPTNIAPAVASAANRATGGYAGHVANTARNTVATATKQVVRGALGQNKV